MNPNDDQYSQGWDDHEPPNADDYYGGSSQAAADNYDSHPERKAL
jgi:hypothetical protein